MFKSFAFRIYVVALILHLIPVLLTRDLGIGLDDMFQYDMLARSLAQGNGFRWYAQADLDRFASFLTFDLSSLEKYDPRLGIPTSFRAPLYPVFLALVYFINGIDPSRFFAARLAQAIFLGAPLAPLTYFAAKRLLSQPSTFLSPYSTTLESGKHALPREHRDHVSAVEAWKERAARLSAWIVAAYPLLLVYPLGLGTENPFFILLLASFLFLLKFHERPNSLNSLLLGLFLSLTALTRSVILLFALAAFCLLLYWHGKRAILSILSFSLIVTPWVVRNSLLHHKPTGIETSMGYNLYLGYHPQGNGSFVFGPSLDLLTILDDAERDRIGTQKALEFIQARPERFVPLAINRLGFFFGLEKRVLMYFYSNNIVGYVSLPLLLTISAILLLPFVLISASAALGLSLLRWAPQTCFLALLLICYTLPHVFILSEDRFHLALVPYIAILAAQFWVNGFGALSVRWSESQTGKILVILSIPLVFLLLTNWILELARDWDKISQLLGPTGNQTYFPY